MARMWCPLCPVCTLVVCGRLQCRPIDRPCACCSCHCWLCTSCSLLARTQLLHRWASKASTSRSLCVAEDTYEDVAYTGVTVGTAYPPTHAADLLQACDLRLSTFPDTMTCVKCKAYPDQVHDDGDHLGGGASKVDESRLGGWRTSQHDGEWTARTDQHTSSWCGNSCAMFGDCTMFNDCQQHCSNTGVSVKPESGKKQGPGPTNCRLAAGNPSGCRHVELAQDSLPCVKGLLLI
jgi:hypothetical protein